MLYLFKDELLAVALCLVIVFSYCSIISFVLGNYGLLTFISPFFLIISILFFLYAKSLPESANRKDENHPLCIMMTFMGLIMLSFKLASLPWPQLASGGNWLFGMFFALPVAAVLSNLGPLNLFVNIIYLVSIFFKKINMKNLFANSVIYLVGTILSFIASILYVKDMFVLVNGK